MRLKVKQLRRVIRESIISEMGFRDMRHPSERGQKSLQDYEDENHAECVQKCFAAIPPMMKQICKMGMAHTVMNDIYHLCAPICEKMGCDCDVVSQVVQDMCCC